MQVDKFKSILDSLIASTSEAALDAALQNVASDCGYFEGLPVAWSYWHYGKHAERAEASGQALLAVLFRASWAAQTRVLLASSSEEAERERAAIRAERMGEAQKVADRKMNASREFAHALRVNGVQLMTGDAKSLGVILGNLDGRNFTFQAGHTQSHQEWLAFMRAELKHALAIGAEIQLLDPSGRELQRSTIGHGAFDAWVGGLEQQMASDIENPEAYRIYYEQGLTPADAVLQERINAGVLDTPEKG